MSVSGLPTGVTANPATFSLTPGKEQQLTLTAAASAQPAMASVTFQGTSGNLSHSAQTSLAIVVSVSGAHPPIRTRYLRTNSFYDPNSLQYAPPHFTVYDAAHKQFFVSNTFMNEVDVFDATQETEIARIPVPLAWALDISPHNGTLFAGTMIGDIYQIDTSNFVVMHRYLSASIGPTGFAATTVLVLSDGRLALQGGSGGAAVLGVDGYGVSVVWDPVTNSLDSGTKGSVCDVGNEGAFALSGDRTRILVSTVDEGGGGEPVCSYDPIAKVATYGAFPPPQFVQQIIPTPDGSRFFLTSGSEVAVFDARTVQLLAQFNAGVAGSVGCISLDGKTLYLGSGPVGAFDTTSLAQTGWVPTLTVNDLQSGVVISAIDGTGLIVGPIGHGVGFIDASQMTATQPTLISSGYATPPTGPLGGGTTVSNFVAAKVTDSAVLDEIYVGNVPGSFASFGNSANGYEIEVTTPPANQTGAVDLSVLLSDGGVGLVPEGFSYGPTILEVVPNGATAEGGETGAIIGYGFGDSTSGIQVTIGGRAAPVTAVYNFAPIEPYPFPINGKQFTIPPGVPGTDIDVTVTTPAGSVTATGAFHYTAAVQSYPLTANLQSGIYDAHRDLYYFADQAQIQVLSKTTGTWLSPISLPGVSSKTQLLAISESPDGTKLAVSDFGGQAVYVLDPSNPASAQRYPMSLDNDGFAADLAPGGLAVTDKGVVYFATGDINGTGTPSFQKLNTATRTITDLGQLTSASGSSDAYNRVLLSPDGSKIYSSESGDVTIPFRLNTSNDQINFSASDYIYVGQELEVSADGSTVNAAGKWYDNFLNQQIGVVYIDWETWFPIAASGQKLSQDGSILFQPLTDGIDMIARNTGRLLYRVQIPITPASVYDSLVVAEEQNTLAVVTAGGVSFVDLSSLPIGAAYTQPFANATHSETGSFVELQAVVPPQRALSGRSTHRPQLRRRLEQSKGYFRTR
jgi:hypothetical protein